MPNPQNLKRPKKGEVRNPNGRPKGSRNRSTIIRELLEMTEKIKNPISGNVEQLSQTELATLAIINQARKGNVRAYEKLMEFGYPEENNVPEVKISVEFVGNAIDENK